MNPQVSTFDKLVDSLSTEEAQTMLARIAENMKMSEDIQTDSQTEPLLIGDQLKKSIRINDESFFLRSFKMGLVFTLPHSNDGFVVFAVP